ncbi:serine/threonine-protein kinase NLK2-like [Schistocerca serialis cubense]|uniref:serine/threonine-protein kinase NLK2-like n=1 Tax=Schistocerca serialis cubense TaxID=2023355 RepID=UPI00214DF25C|nr:serine/threonine-protein kinase NLK2-like [Schistocerca serialis cubense]
MLRRAPKPPSMAALYTLASQATHEAVHLLCQTLVFDPDKRITVGDALAHPYLDEGRLRYHSCMCKCCYTTPGGLRQYTPDFEPVAPHSFDDLWEKKLTSVQQNMASSRRYLNDDEIRAVLEEGLGNVLSSEEEDSEDELLNMSEEADPNYEPSSSSESDGDETNRRPIDDWNRKLQTTSFKPQPLLLNPCRKTNEQGVMKKGI